MVTISLYRVEYIPYYIVSDLANITTEAASFFQILNSIHLEIRNKNKHFAQAP